MIASLRPPPSLSSFVLFPLPQNYRPSTPPRAATATATVVAWQSCWRRLQVQSERTHHESSDKTIELLL